MKRLLPLLVVLAVPVTGCSLGQAVRATYVTDRSATVNGSVFSTENAGVTYSDDHSIDYWFRYGTTTDYGSETAHRTLRLGPHPYLQAFPVSAPVLILEPSTTYHYTLCADDAQPDVPPYCAGDQTVTTSSVAGRSGIAFGTYRNLTSEIYVMNPDGSDAGRLTTNDAFDGNPAWSPDTTKLIFDTNRDGNNEVYSMDAFDGGHQTNLTNNPALESCAAWSPDGSLIAFCSTRSGHFDIYTMHPDGTHQVRLTDNGFDNVDLAWSPDGTQLVFRRDDPGANSLVVMNADGTGQVALAAAGGAPAWSPDGTKIAFLASDGLSVVDRDGSNQTLLLDDPVPAYHPSWSPDGTKLTFQALAAGLRDEVYVINADGTGLTDITNNPATDFSPAWSPRPAASP